MPSCVFRRCSNYTATVKERSDISFHTFPKDELMKLKWIKIIRHQRREDDWMPTPYSTVCSQHFSETDLYVTNKHFRRLKKTAVPILPVTKMSCTKASEMVFSPTSLDESNASDTDLILDTASTAYFKSKIAELTKAKRKLQYKTYNMARRHKKLHEKCDKLKKTVIRLKRFIRNHWSRFHSIPVDAQTTKT